MLRVTSTSHVEVAASMDATDAAFIGDCLRRHAMDEHAQALVEIDAYSAAGDQKHFDQARERRRIAYDIQSMAAQFTNAAERTTQRATEYERRQRLQAT